MRYHQFYWLRNFVKFNFKGTFSPIDYNFVGDIKTVGALGKESLEHLSQLRRIGLALISL